MQSHPKLAKVNMLKFGDVNSIVVLTSNAATTYDAKISVLRLNIGSGMLRLS